jgi:hypothetical protein
MVWSACRSGVAGACLLAVLGPLTLPAQNPACDPNTAPAGIVLLCEDGNGVAALRARIALPLIRSRVGEALQRVARAASLNLTLDPRLPGVDDEVAVPAGEYVVASVLLRIITGKRLSFEVTRAGGLILAAAAALPEATVTLIGRILDADATPVGRAMIRIGGTSLSATTDDSGRFVIHGLRRGDVTVRVSSYGFAGLDITLATETSDTVTLEARLIAIATPLAAVRTVAVPESRTLFLTAPSLGKASFTGREISSTPVFFEPDVLRSVQLMPGVEARNDYSAGLNVRGGESDQNLILLDGYPIYNPFHLGGLLGTFIDPTVGRVDLSAGSLPVRYGGRLSSVLDVVSAEESRRGLHGTADVSLLATTASIGSALENGGSWMIAARRTYADVIADLFKPNSLPYRFFDVQGHLSRVFPGGAIASVTAYVGQDGSSVTSSDEPTDVSWGNGLLGATVTKTFDHPRSVFGRIASDSLRVVQRASLSTFDARVDLANRGFDLRSDVADARLSGSATLFSRHVDQSFGYELVHARVRYALSAPLTVLTNFLPRESFDQSPSSISGWYEALWRVSPALLAAGGLRMDEVSGTSRPWLSPRLSVKYFLAGDLAIAASAGEYAQWMHSLAQEDAPITPLQLWVASDRTLPVSRMREYTAGLEQWRSPDRFLRVEGFYKRYQNLVETNPLDDPGVTGDEFIELGGTSYGVEILARQLQTQQFGGWISYTFAVSERTPVNGAAFSPSHDRRHNLNIVANRTFGRYVLAVRFGLESGTPYTPILGQFTRERYDPLTNTWRPDAGGADVQYLSGAVNSARYPLEHRLDVRVTKLAMPGRTQIVPYLSVANVYGASNPAAYVFDYTRTPPTRFSIPNLPFLPTIGVRIAF